MPPKHADPAQLSDKDTNNYKMLVRVYDNREYSRGIRLADQILAHSPDHADTKGIKALCLHATAAQKSEPNDEAYALVKDGIRNNFRSSVCWHALGIMHRADKKPEDAMKAFRSAEKCDPTVAQERTNNVLRDLSSLAVHLRDWETFTEVRKKLLTKNSNVRANWICYAMGHHQLGNKKVAGGILDVMSTVMEIGDSGYERNEILLYRATLHVECGEPQKALDLIRKETITDKVEVIHIESKAYAALQDQAKAEEACWKLIDLADSERDVLFRLAEIRKIDKLTPFKFDRKNNGPYNVQPNAAFCALLDEASKKFPRCDAAKRLTLDYCPLDQFEDRLKKYCAPYITKMVPSILSVLKSLYHVPERVAIIERVFTAWESALKDGKPPTEIAAANAPRNPLLHLCVLEFLASHFMRKSDFANAHKFIDAAIAHTPTIEMLYLMRAKILMREGRREEAAEAAEKARVLDLQDKYVNSKAAKYFLRAGKIQEAEDRLRIFHRPSEVPDTYLTMFESQCRWYERELGDCYFAKGDVIGALHCYLLNERHARDDFEEVDTLQFHALKRGNIRPWLQTMNCFSHFDSAQFSMDLAPRLIRAYLALYDGGEEQAREKQIKREELPEKIRDPEDAARIARGKPLLFEPELTAPIARCGNYVQAMKTHCPDFVETHSLSFEVGIRAKRLLQCVAAVRSLERLQREYTATNQPVPKAAQAESIAELKQRLEAAKGDADPRVVALMAKNL